VSLAAGECRRIEYAVDTRHRRGDLHKRVSVHVSAPGSRAHESIGLDITATVLPSLFFDPAKIYLPEVPTLTGASHTIDVFGRGIDFDVLEVSVGGDANGLTITRDKPIEAVALWGELYLKVPVTITVPPGTPIGEHAWDIRFRTNRDAVR
jgi:hypothetical protein